MNEEEVTYLLRQLARHFGDEDSKMVAYMSGYVRECFASQQAIANELAENERLYRDQRLADRDKQLEEALDEIKRLKDELDSARQPNLGLVELWNYASPLELLEKLKRGGAPRIQLIKLYHQFRHAVDPNCSLQECSEFVDNYFSFEGEKNQ